MTISVITTPNPLTVSPLSSVASMDNALGFGSAVSIGNGIFLTAAHVLTGNTANLLAGATTLSLREGFSNAVIQNSIQNFVNSTNLFNLGGYGGVGNSIGEDIGLVRTSITTAPQNAMIIVPFRGQGGVQTLVA